MAHKIFRKGTWSKGSRVAIFSDENPARAAAESKKAVELLTKQVRRTNGIEGVESVAGVWGGKSEKSYIAYGMSEKMVRYLGRIYGQEAVIHGRNGKFWLIDIASGQKTLLGKSVTGGTAANQPADGYTLLPTGEWFQIA
jgi:hypothetical protein